MEFLESFYAERIGLPAVDFLMRPFCNICASLITCLFQAAQSLFKVHFPISLASTTIVDTRPVTKVHLFPSFKALIIIGQNDIVYGALLQRLLKFVKNVKQVLEHFCLGSGEVGVDEKATAEGEVDI